MLPILPPGDFLLIKEWDFFVDGLLEFGRISKSEKESIKQQCLSKGKSYQEVLNEASKTISGLSNYAGIVIAPKYQKKNKTLGIY